MQKEPWHQRLRHERISRNWRQSDLAEQLGVAITTVQHWERGRHLPSAYFRVKLSALFGNSMQEVNVEDTLLSPILVTSKEADADDVDNKSPKERALWTVPYTRNPYFTGREYLLDQLFHQFAPPSANQPAFLRRAILTQIQAIKGLGGIGKTQIAIEFAYRCLEQGRYIHTLWVVASSEETIQKSFVELTALLPEMVTQGMTDQRKLVAAALLWLEQCEQPWLLIFDNADALPIVQPYLPRHGNGCILLTTRAQATGSLAPSLEVELMEQHEAIYFLRRRAQRCVDGSPQEIEEARTIVETLARFPLALDQAGAYIDETKCSFRDYLQIYQERHYALLSRRGMQITSYPESVATTWSLSFTQIKQANPAAADLLRLCACLAPDHIPEELFTEGASYWPPALRQATADRFAFNQLLQTLLAFSLVTRCSEGHFLGIHRLVQVIQMEQMTPQEQRQWATCAVLAIYAIFPHDPEHDVSSWPQCLRYLEQAYACSQLIQRHHILLPEAAEVLHRIATYLRERAFYPLAEPLYQQAIQIREKQGGAEHLDVAASLHGLAKVYRLQDRYAQAGPLYERALRIREQQVGVEHPLVADSVHDLADLSRGQGKFADAEQLYERALCIRERQLGTEHPQVANTLNNLAILYENQGKFADAERLNRRALYIREQSLGAEHPLVAVSLNNLAILFHRQKNYTEAEHFYRQAFHIWEQQIGSEHPLVAASLNNLAILFHRQENYAEAEHFYRQAFHIWEQQIGSEHPLIATSLYNLAIFYSCQGKYAEAEPLCEKALAIREQQVGVEHPDLATFLNGLAHVYIRQGKYTQAEPLFQRAIHLCTLELDYPKVAYPLDGVAANCCNGQGNCTDVRPLHTRTLSIWEQQVGPEYPEVAYPLSGLARLYREQGKNTEAEALYTSGLHIRERLLGSEHLETAALLHEFAGFQHTCGKYGEAVVLYQRALTICEQALGCAHAKTIDVRQCLQAVLSELSE
ncbi:tetratricopeptide repeat protein [Dictyobacter sp. S3.2.2.5]|uniref:Tetratricopeptide repeat protein n=1 Tax=Dictyobacter halimunensis TaxID=3026934 RepID=A0ABQ6FNL1_9CHLR|nr:tetratricopeptide repeat protein [Dictyobacter sp. S3.2.2.5]